VVTAHEDEPHFLACLEVLRGFLEDEQKYVVGSNIAFDVSAEEYELEFRAKAQLVDVGILYYELRQYKQPSLKQLARGGARRLSLARASAGPVARRGSPAALQRRGCGALP
jgi:hypothetical protein